MNDNELIYALEEIRAFLADAKELLKDVKENVFFKLSFEEMKSRIDRLYKDVLPSNYESGFLFPPTAKRRLGEKTGQALSALYADLISCVGFALRAEEDKLALFSELFSECEKKLAGLTEDKAKGEAICRCMADFYKKNAGLFVSENIRRMVVFEEDYIRSILDDSTELNDLRYLYRYGLYIGENEIKTAEYLNHLSTDDIHRIADTFVGGYIKGFYAAGKDIKKKRTVKVEYPAGFERVAREALLLFKKEGLCATFVPEAFLSFMGRGESKRGVYASSPNRRFDFEHKDDKGLYLSEELLSVRTDALKEAFEGCKKEAGEHGGPAVIEVFGEELFSPTPDTANYVYTDEQNRQLIEFAAKSAELTNKYIPGEERSFTIISFPLPAIGDNYPEIFKKVLEVNTLDYMLYRDIQQRIIDTLDQGEIVSVKGAGANITDMKIRLHPLDDPKSQTNFENCVADVNIPVGEVFTSPCLEGTEGTLFVSHAFLGEYEYRNLRLDFSDGCVTDYSCETPGSQEKEAGRKLIRDHIFHHHKSLPIGEFAIGTNTTAYRLARDYDLEAKLPILIMEKTGPHFAVGDTCYSYQEDVPMYNPDGKECIARDNSFSILRKSDDEEERKGAYFHCHTDITIPFDELDSITVIKKDGERIDIISKGLFVLPGTESLNLPLQERSTE